MMLSSCHEVNILIIEEYDEKLNFELKGGASFKITVKGERVLYTCPYELINLMAHIRSFVPFTMPSLIHPSNHFSLDIKPFSRLKDTMRNYCGQKV